VVLCGECEASLKKEKHCDRSNPADADKGEVWDWVIVDAESKLAISLVVGPRTAEVAEAVFEDFAGRTDAVPPLLVTTDALAAYETAIRKTYPTANRARSATPVYATLVKRKEKNRVVEVSSRVVIGSQRRAKAALEGRKVSTSYVERYNATSRHFNARKTRKSYCFSKDLDMHLWVGWLCLCFYNFEGCCALLDGADAPPATQARGTTFSPPNACNGSQFGQRRMECRATAAISPLSSTTLCGNQAPPIAGSRIESRP
jgi:IS1 family transposase